jgi:hypothetical protein
LTLNQSSQNAEQQTYSTYFGNSQLVKAIWLAKSLDS